MTTTESDTTYPSQPGLQAAEHSWLQRGGRGLSRFIRRSPLSAFWGCIAAAILLMAIAADLILAMAIAMALGAGIGTVIVAIAITRIPFGGRVIRAVVLSLKEMSYVEAARGLGASHLRMMARHILPQCVAPYLILATTHLGVAIIIEAALGFLGVGIPPPTPTWGNMLSDALNAGLVPPWWLVLFPGLAITITVLAFNLLGDGIRDILDPRLRSAV
jgi:ABC-type dipeptide/oligopeptide/nickel transport system permease subunit